MEIIVNSFSELKDKIKKIDSSSYLKLNVNKGDLNYFIVVQKAKCKFLGNMSMELYGVYDVFIENISLIYREIKVPEELINYYIDLLEKADNEYIIGSIRLLMKMQYKIGDTIEFDNGRKGKIIEPKVSHTGQMYYKLIKKDGSEGVKELLLYGKSKNYNYKCLDREFKDYSVL